MIRRHILRALPFLMFLLFVQLSFGQQKQCECKLDTSINQFTTNCKTTLLNNGSKLYWQFNCNSIWLTLENKIGTKVIIDTVPIGLYSYTFRLGFQLAKEYKGSLLFRSGCPANGPCNFVLIDKSNGKKLKEFGELIYDHTSKKFYDFVIFLSSSHTLTLYYIDTNRKYKIPINSKDFKAVIQEYEFDDVIVKNNMLTLTYGVKKKIVLDLKQYVR